MKMPRVLWGYIAPDQGSAPHGSSDALAAAPGSREPSCFDLLALAQLPPERQPPARARLCAFYAGSCQAPQGRAACTRMAEETCRARTRRCGEPGGHAGARVQVGIPFLVVWVWCTAGAMAFPLHPQSCTPTPRPWWISCAGLGTSSETSLTSPSSLAPCLSSWARSMGISSLPVSAGMPQVPSRLGHSVPVWGPISPCYAGGRGTSSLPWHPHGAPRPLVPPVPFLSPQTQLWQGASPAPQQKDPRDTLPGKAWWAMGHRGLQGLGARHSWALTWLFGDSLKHWSPALPATRARVEGGVHGPPGRPGPSRCHQG